jgi:uncharacterized damage-inducible protein DinB
MEARDLIQGGLENSKRLTDRVIDGLTPEELKWQPGSDANSIGLILFHMARSEDTFLNTFIKGKPSVWETEKWYLKLGKAAADSGSHYTAEQVAAFTVPEPAQMRAYADAVRRQTLDFVKDLTPAGLAARVELPAMGPPPKPTADSKPAPPRRLPFEPVVGVLLMLTVTHLAQHAGEISYLRGLQRGMDK